MRLHFNGLLVTMCGVGPFIKTIFPNPELWLRFVENKLAVNRLTFVS